ncbi:hypothetical protein CJ030_MR1G002256 [Morella rubra]|uniref:Uncharacterized protein n=1 Tax=Morella rubra TaxID=262757 RepID=A0A6A1WW86_9ROSI|nr:hypothetical protein CJ030_MR1G002256 [Morella rubra]
MQTGETEIKAEIEDMGCVDDGGTCAICLDTVLQEIALVKGGVFGPFFNYTSLPLSGAGSFREPTRETAKSTCRRAKRALKREAADKAVAAKHQQHLASLHDYMFEESVCLLLRAPWFKHLTVDQHKEVCDPYAYEEADDPYEEDLDETYLRNSSSNRIRRRAKRACRREACS